MFTCFDTILERDKRRDGRTDKIQRLRHGIGRAMHSVARENEIQR